jgi:hypothetical protein
MRSTRCNQSGGSILAVLFITGLITLTLTAYLSWANSQYRMVARSQNWNAALPLAEAGIEEALSHLTLDGNNVNNGWTISGTNYSKRRDFSSCYYFVQISTNEPPVIISQGSVLAPTLTTQYISRKVKVIAQKSGGAGFGILSKTAINLGSDFKIDSFDSTDLAASTLGLYDAAKRKDNGGLGSISTTAGAIQIADSQIYGPVYVAPGVPNSFGFGSHGSAGSLAWHTSGGLGLEPSAFHDDLTVSIPDAPAAPAGAVPPGAPATIGGVLYSWVLTSGDYIMSSTLKGNVYVSGNATLTIPTTGRIQFGGSDVIKIINGANLKMYNASTIDAVMSGVSNDSGMASRFTYYGLPTTAGSKITFTGNGQFAGTVYAPQQKLVLNGGSASDQDFIGSIVGNDVTMSGHFYLHYDESLSTNRNSNYVVASWDEL